MAKNSTGALAAPSSNKRKSRNFPGESAPRPPKVKHPLAGTFVANYLALGLQGNPPTPRLGTDYTPQATIVCFVFKNDGTHSGEIHRNVAGISPSILRFKGTYSLAHNDALDALDGEIRVELLASNGTVFRTQVLYVVRKSHDAITFLLRESLVETTIKTLEGATVKVLMPIPAGAIVHGTMERVS